MQVAGEADVRVLALVVELDIAARVLDADSSAVENWLRSVEDKADDGTDSAEVCVAGDNVDVDVGVGEVESVEPIREIEPSDVWVVLVLTSALEEAVGTAVDADAMYRLCSETSVDFDVVSVDSDADDDLSVAVSTTPRDSLAGVELGDEELANGEDRAGTGV